MYERFVFMDRNHRALVEQHHFVSFNNIVLQTHGASRHSLWASPWSAPTRRRFGPVPSV